MKFMLSIIIPCYNESQVLKKTFDSLDKSLENKKFKFEIIFINNGSTDNSIEILNSIKKENSNIVVLNTLNKGKGLAIKEGILNSKYNKVLFLDADLSVGIEELKNEMLESEEILYIGSRKIGTEKGTPFIRRLAGNILNLIIRKLLNLPYKDTQCGFKFISTNNIIKIAKNLSVDGFMYDLDFILTAKKYNLKIEEIPIQYNHNLNTSVSLLKDPWKMLSDIFKIHKKFS